MYSVLVFCLSPPEECLSSLWFRNRTFLAKPGLAEGGNDDLVFTNFPRDEGGPPSGLKEASRSGRVRTFHAPKILLLLLLILTAFKGKTASRDRLASFSFRMSFL